MNCPHYRISIIISVLTREENISFIDKQLNILLAGCFHTSTNDTKKPTNTRTITHEPPSIESLISIRCGWITFAYIYIIGIIASCSIFTQNQVKDIGIDLQQNFRALSPSILKSCVSWLSTVMKDGTFLSSLFLSFSSPFECRCIISPFKITSRKTLIWQHSSKIEDSHCSPWYSPP